MIDTEEENAAHRAHGTPRSREECLLVLQLKSQIASNLAYLSDIKSSCWSKELLAAGLAIGWDRNPTGSKGIVVGKQSDSRSRIAYKKSN